MKAELLMWKTINQREKVFVEPQNEVLNGRDFVSILIVTVEEKWGACGQKTWLFKF